MPDTAENEGDWLEEEIAKEERQMDKRDIEEERQEKAQKEAGLDHFDAPGYISARLRHSGAMQKSRSRIGQ